MVSVTCTWRPLTAEKAPRFIASLVKNAFAVESDEKVLVPAAIVAPPTLVVMLKELNPCGVDGRREAQDQIAGQFCCIDCEGDRTGQGLCPARVEFTEGPMAPSPMMTAFASPVPRAALMLELPGTNCETSVGAPMALT